VSYAHLRNSSKSFYCSLIYHFHHFHTLTSYFTQICPVDLIQSIFSICLHFHRYLIGSLLMHLSNFVIFLNIFSLQFFISLFTVFIWRSSWILELFIYQGAFSITFKVFDWKRWSILMLEFEAVPHI
jgi:hypothetical protein